MKISTKLLKDAVKLLRPAFKKGEIEALGQYIFIKDKFIFAYNGEIKVSVPIGIEGSYVFPSTEFTKLLNKIKTTEISIEAKSDSEVVIRADKVKAGFATNEKVLSQLEDFPDTPDEFKALPTDFHQGIKLTAFSTQKNTILRNLWIKEDTIASTDNYRISKYTFDAPFECDFFLPVTSAKELLKYPVSFYTFTDDFIHFITDDNLMISCKTVEVTFPEIDEYIGNMSGESIRLPAKMKDMIDITSIMTDKADIMEKCIDVNISGGQIVCKSDSDIGFIETVNDIEIDEDLNFVINPILFKDILSVCQEMILNKESEWVLFHNDKYRHLIMLLK